MAGGSNLVMGHISRKIGSNAEVMVTLKSRITPNLHPSHSTQGKSLKSPQVQRIRSSIPTEMEDGADKKRCVLILRSTGARPMVVGTW